MDANQILEGNCLDVLRGLPDAVVDCVMTSPPYWALRDYMICSCRMRKSAEDETSTLAGGGNATPSHNVDPLPGCEICHGTGKVGADTVWDAQEGCEHEFETEHITQSLKGSVSSQIHTGDKLKQYEYDFERGFCRKCSAWKGQLGQEPTPDFFVKHLADIFDEVKRVLKPEGTCWVNLGDSYTGSGVHKASHANPGMQGRKQERAAEPQKRPEFKGIPSKCLCMIPARFAIEMTSRGWHLRNEIIWHKRTAMPESVTDRFTNNFEKIYFFSKSEKYLFNQVKMPVRDSSTQRAKYGYSGSPVPKGVNKRPDIEGPAGEKMAPSEGANMRSVWTVRTSNIRGNQHYAAYSTHLCGTPIRAGCPEGGIVFDPFMGSGTTAIAAVQLGRRYLGIEINPSYAKMARKRIKDMEVYLSGKNT